MGFFLILKDSLLPPFLRLNSKITYEHDGQYHKGFLGIKDEMHQFVYKSHVNKCKVDWSVALLNLQTTWESVLIPGHVSHIFLCSSASPQQSTFDPIASFVSTVNFHQNCPPTLLRALTDSHPDREIWLQSYYEEN